MMGRLALAGRPFCGDHGWVDQAAVLRELKLGDSAPTPRLGGMARSHGVVIVSEHFWAYAGVDGTIREGDMPQAPRALRAIPFARGLVRLAASLAPLFKRTGVARGRERTFLLVAILAPLALVFAPRSPTAAPAPLPRAVPPPGAGGGRPRRGTPPPPPPPWVVARSHALPPRR